MVDQLVSSQWEKITKHDLHNRVQAAQCQTRSNTDNPGF